MRSQEQNKNGVHIVLGDDIQRQISDTLSLSKQYKVYPYHEVKRDLDKLAIDTAKKTAEEFAKQFEKWGGVSE
jgi:hypothetical protein